MSLVIRKSTNYLSVYGLEGFSLLRSQIIRVNLYAKDTVALRSHLYFNETPTAVQDFIQCIFSFFVL